MKNGHISFRFRKELDDDIIEAIADMERQDITELCKKGLRIMLGIRMERTFQVAEKPLVIPQPKPIGAAKPKLFTPSLK